MEKKMYTEMKAEIIAFNSEDIITTSGGGDNCGAGYVNNHEMVAPCYLVPMLNN